MAINGVFNFKDKNGDVTTVYPVTGAENVSGLSSALAGKVDKETGKGLSTEDFTTVEKNKLSGIEPNANNYVHPVTVGWRHVPSGGTSGQILGWAGDGTAQWVDNSGSGTEYSDATPTSHGLMSAADKSKLDGIASGATAVHVDSELSNTSTNPVQNKVVYSAVSGKVDKVTGKGLSTNDFTDAEKSKLSGIAEGAEVNVQADWNQTTSTSDDYIKNKPSLGTAAAASAADFATAAQGTKADNAIPSSAKGTANGVAELDSNGLVPASQLPSFVDDILEYASYSGFPETGETGKIYVDKSDNKTYRWSGSIYVEISPSLALGTTSSTAYRGDRGQTAYEHATDASRLTTAKTSDLYKIAATAEGHVASATPVTKSDITALGIPAQDTTYSEATTSTSGLMSASDKAKLNGISAGAEKMYDIDVSKLANFDPDDISVALNSIVSTLTQGKRVYLPYGEYNVRNPITLHAPDFCTFHLFGRIHSYVSGNCFSIGGSFCEFVFDDLRGDNVGTAILVNKNFSYSRLRMRYIGNFANGLVFKMSAGREDFVQYSKINFEFISNIVNKCIWIDGSTHDGWVNENTFVGGRLKGGYGIYIEGGTTEQGVGFDGNKFYNIGFEEIDNDGVYINGETYSNAFLHCRAMEGIGTHLINEVSQQLGHNQYYFDCVVPNDKIIINGHRSTYHGTIANQYTQWIAGGKDKTSLLPHDARTTIHINDVDKTETIDANGNKKVQYGIPGVERYEPIMVFVKTQSTQDGFDYRNITANVTNFDVNNGLFDVVYNSTLGYAVELHMTYRIIYRWVG